MAAQMEVAVGIVWRGDCFLASKRPRQMPLAGYWEFPGGKIEEGESPYSALCRELEEELGIFVQKAEFWKIFTHFYARHAVEVRLHFFHVRAFLKEPAPLEGQNLHWVNPAEAKNMDFLPADIAVLAELCTGNVAQAEDPRQAAVPAGALTGGISEKRR
ncbi:MAG: (deoxy)nucleoside triphosphate pyrophosphohydrolase [Desulfovibrio sp.]|jgi:8-oxo-dGTP diphosphatase|nr:(deoxy)nucleoside triphosphate pyrophosphohydrolase [Desulfovibrio sp.]